MKIFTYYEDINFTKQDELLYWWKKSWSKSGFEPVVLTNDDALKNPKFEPFKNRIQELHQEIIGGPITQYGMACYARWFAVATQDCDYCYASDYDIMNNSLTSDIFFDINKLHLLNNCCPCFTFGSPKLFDKLGDIIISITEKNLEKLKGNIKPWYHDQEFFSKNREDIADIDWININKWSEKKSKSSATIVADARIRDYLLDPIISSRITAVHFSHNSIHKSINYTVKQDLVDMERVRVDVVSGFVKRKMRNSKNA